MFFFARLFAVRRLMRFAGGAVRSRAAALVDLRKERRRDEQQEDQNEAAHQTALPRMRSAARRARASASVTIVARAAATSPLSF